MKSSQYNILVPIEDNQCLLYNTFTTSMIVLENALYQNIFVNKDYHFDIVSQMIELGFIVEDDRNENEEILKLRNQSIGTFHGIKTLTIVLTTACNARCSYCFEQGINPYTLTKQLCDKIVEFIIANCLDNEISISWFGGEPLLAFDKLKYIVNKLKDNNIRVYSHITTNGSLISDEIIKFSQTNAINHYQITIDDIGENYETIKNYINLKNGYNIVINNVKRLLRSGIQVALRINYRLQEIDYAEKIFKHMINEFSLSPRKENLYIYLAPLSLHNEQFITDRNHPYFRMMKIMNSTKYKVNMWRHGVSRSNNNILSLYSLEPIGLSCGMEREDRIVIDADGFFYRCHRMVGRREFACGNLNDGIDKLNPIYRFFSVGNPIKDECSTCAVFPLCLGGCKSNYYLYNECDKCNPIKYFINDAVKAYFDEIKKHQEK